MYYCRCPLDTPEMQGIEGDTIDQLKAKLINHVKQKHGVTGAYLGGVTDRVAADTWADTYVPANCHQ